MNIKSLCIYSQNVRKNKILTDTILETEKNSSDIILIQEPPWYTIKSIPSPSSADGTPIYGHPSHPEWTSFARDSNNHDDIPRAITYINKRLNSLQPLLCQDILDHRDINLVSLVINHRCSYILNVYSDDNQTAISVMNRLSCTKFFSIFLFF